MQVTTLNSPIKLGTVPNYSFLIISNPLLLAVLSLNNSILSVLIYQNMTALLHLPDDLLTFLMLPVFYAVQANWSPHILREFYKVAPSYTLFKKVLFSTLMYLSWDTAG